MEDSVIGTVNQLNTWMEFTLDISKLAVDGQLNGFILFNEGTRLPAPSAFYLGAVTISNFN